MAQQHVPSGNGPDVASLTVAVLGGTGDQGWGLAAGSPAATRSSSAPAVASGPRLPLPASAGI